MKMSTTPTVLAAALAMHVAPSPVAAQPPTITNLGTVPDGSGPLVTAVAGDGSSACGVIRVSGQERAFRWTVAGGMELVPLPPGSTPPAFGRDVTGGGNGGGGEGGIVVGEIGLGAGARAFTSAPGVGTVLLPAITGGTGRTLATGVSKGGGRVVGSGATPATELAVIWDTQTGTHQTLGTLAGGTYSLGLAISASGSVAAGEASIVGGAVRTFRWTAAAGMEDIGVVPSALFMFCGDLSADGNAIVGTAIRPAGASAYLYLNVGGQGGVIALPNLFGATSSGATGVTGDGSIIVGKATVPGVGGGSGDRATLYTSELGTVDLNAYFSTLGVDLTGWRLTEAAAISDDGRAVVGNGFLNNTPAAWIVRGLTGCTPEVSNSSGTVQTCAGGDAEFFVSLLPGGGGPVTFAWRVDGLLIDPLVNPSAATNRLVIRGVTTEDSGVYDCVITNSCGSTFSEAFTLSVLPSNLPMCCSADFNGDGEVNADDLGDYINCYFQNFIAPGACPAADVNTDGEINGDDLADYINTYFGPPC